MNKKVKCKLCGAKKPQKEYYFRNDSKTYRKACKECTRECRRIQSHGVTNVDYEIMFNRQKGVCGICQCELDSSIYTRFSVDHCHETGIVRELLCNNCNTGIGLFKECPKRLSQAIDYLKKHK